MSTTAGGGSATPSSGTDGTTTYRIESALGRDADDRDRRVDAVAGADSGASQHVLSLIQNLGVDGARSRRPRRLLVTRSRLIPLAIVAVLAIAVGGFIAYDQVLRGDSVAALTLPAATPSAPSSSAPSASAGASASQEASGAPVSEGGVAGTWNATTGSEAGYRVREQLANLPAESDAVGRTSDVTGSISVEQAGDGAKLTAGSLTVNTQTIASDEGRRDNRLRSEGLQTDQFPTATFTVTQPVDVPAAALAGTPTDVTLTGDLTLHGVTKSVQIPAQAQLVNGTIQVAGSIAFPLSDYQITAPNVGGFILSIADQGTLEFLVTFAKG